MANADKWKAGRGNNLLGVALFCAALLVIIAIIGFNPYDWPAGGHPEEITNPLKHLGAIIAFVLINFTFGQWGCLCFVPLIILWSIQILRGGKKPWKITFILLVWGLMTGWLIEFLSKSYHYPLPNYKWGMISGGVAGTLGKFTGITGAWIFTAAALLVLMEVSFSFKFLTTAGAKLSVIYANLKTLLTKKTGKIKGEKKRTRRKSRIEKKVDIEQLEIEPTSIEIRRNDMGSAADSEKIKSDVKEGDERYNFPSVDLLTSPDESFEMSAEELRTSATSLEERLAEFGVEARVIEINPGPIITRFDLQPAAGVKINRIVSLQDDLSLSMRARSMRILAPIPGEAAVGVEVPNRKINLVRLRTLIESKTFNRSKSLLTLALGVDTKGNPFIADLQEMPHLLVAGTTGSGKSVCLNAILMSILYRARPDRVRLALVDPKKLELSLYVPLLEHHLITAPGTREPVVTRPEDALKLLKSLEVEMERRYSLLSIGGYRSLDEYNHPRQIKEPYIVLVIDELADLMITAGGAVESPIARLAQMGRAIGIHLIVATQRPSVDVLTGVIKANFPCRISFQVATKVDSRTILDANGAETLLGKGDMLYIPPGTSLPIRVHGSFVTSAEVEAVVEHISQQPTQEERVELPDPATSDEYETIELNEDDRDELFTEAARLVAVHQQGSVSLLQRRLKVGYARAARLIDQLERAGIVGPFDGSKARKVLVDQDYLP